MDTVGFREYCVKIVAGLIVLDRAASPCGLRFGVRKSQGMLDGASKRADGFVGGRLHFCELLRQYAPATRAIGPLEQRVAAVSVLGRALQTKSLGSIACRFCSECLCPVDQTLRHFSAERQKALQRRKEAKHAGSRVWTASLICTAHDRSTVGALPEWRCALLLMLRATPCTLGFRGLLFTSAFCICVPLQLRAREQGGSFLPSCGPLRQHLCRERVSGTRTQRGHVRMRACTTQRNHLHWRSCVRAAG